jgi:hypothetical protein
MSTDQVTTNKATLSRFQEALSSGDWELISKTIDEVVEPEALIRTPLPIEATGVCAMTSRRNRAAAASVEAAGNCLTRWESILTTKPAFPIVACTRGA